MKVFYAVQVSNTTKVDGKMKWLLRSDACINLMTGIVSSVLDLKPDWKFLIKMPLLEDIHDLDSFFELFEEKYHESISFYEERIPISPVDSRFNFNMCDHLEYKQMFETIDVMINDENTLTKNWRVLLRSLGLNVPIISTNYFLDSPYSWKVDPSVRYYERQMEALTTSDLCAFPCDAAKKQAFNAWNLLFKTDRNKQKPCESSVWGTGVHAKEVRRYFNLEKLKRPVVYFGNRITETAGSYTNWQAFAKAIGLLHQRGIRNFDAIMLNPTKKVSDQQLKNIIEWSYGQVVVMNNSEPFSREDYLKFINEASISCNLFTKEVHGGLTSYEAMMAENLIVCPEINDYADRFEGFKYPYFCKVDSDLKIDVESLADAIKKALDMVTSSSEELKKTRSMLYQIAYDTQSYEHASVTIVHDIERLHEQRAK